MKERISTMEKSEKNNNSKEYYTVDVVHILKTLWHRAWIIALSGFLAAVLGFSWAAFMIKPSYSSSIMLYVNNSSFALGGTSFSISSSEITAAQSLVKTYGEILNNRTTLERIIKDAGVSYTYRQLSGMISSSSSNGTEIMRVTVTSHDPYEAARIANCIAEYLPVRISQIIDGASMEVVDNAIPNLEKIGPSISKYTLIGLLLGAFGAAAVLVVVAVRDDTVHDEEYVLRTYDYPILAKVPNLLSTGTKHYAYYSQKKKSNG